MIQDKGPFQIPVPSSQTFQPLELQPQVAI
jgi:hypothetical protein